jgi:predicted RNase H-like HicB family nuclease
LDQTHLLHIGASDGRLESMSQHAVAQKGIFMEAVENGYVVIVERDEEGGYGTWSPDLPGCVAAASNYEECVQLMRAAIEFHLEGMRDNGEEIPVPTAIASLILPVA